MIYTIFLTAATLDTYRHRKTHFLNSGNPTKSVSLNEGGETALGGLQHLWWHKCFLSVIETCAWLSSRWLLENGGYSQKGIDEFGKISGWDEHTPTNIKKKYTYRKDCREVV